jgi:predicted adenylyl cyclase CyaB
MREVEVKGVVTDMAACVARIRAAGGELVMQGRLEDRRYDTPDGSLGKRDEVLRVRAFRGLPSSQLTIDWKGPTSEEGGYKVREEISSGLTDSDALIAILGHLGYSCNMAIDREITQFELSGATVRFEEYPRMDTLVEVEGVPEAIERAIEIIGIPRHAFSTERLSAFVSRFEARTGVRAALSESDRERK